MTYRVRRLYGWTIGYGVREWHSQLNEVSTAGLHT